MAKGTFYHLYAIPKTELESSVIENRLNLAVDWFRYAKNHWIIYSTSDIDRWMKRLKPLIEPDGKLFICELNLNNYNGVMSQSFWDWVGKRV